jgi:hypothetical protein
MDKLSRRIGWLALAGCCSGAGLSGCRAGPDHVAWTVVNDSADTLRVRVRYPLDSTWLATPEQLARVRQSWTQDSSAMNGQGYYSWPLRRLVCHHGRWYYVDSRLLGVNGYSTGPEPYARLARAQGLLTYTLLPHSTQLLLTGAYLVGESEPEAPMSGLWLQQGSTRQQVLPGCPVADVFEEGRTDREPGSYNSYSLQLMVGPGLTINKPWFWPWGGK